MANFEIGENPELELSLKKLETTDRAHADLFNSLFKTLINNDAFLNNLANKMVEKSQIVRNLLETEPGKVLDATMGKELGDQITQLDRDVSALNTNFDSYVMSDIRLANEQEINNYFDNYSHSFANFTYYRFAANFAVEHTVLGGGGWFVSGFKVSSEYEWQTAISYTGQAFLRRDKIKGTWNNWDRVCESFSVNKVK